MLLQVHFGLMYVLHFLHSSPFSTSTSWAGCKSDDSYVVWTTINTFFGKLSHLLFDDAETYQEFRQEHLESL